MSAIISYKGNTVATVLAGDHVRLACKGNVMGSNIRVECTADSVEDTNGSYDEGYSAGYNKCTEDMQDELQAKYTEGYDKCTEDMQGELQTMYNQGVAAGKADGYLEGEAAGYDKGLGDGYENGRLDGEAAGYDKGVGDGYDSGRAEGIAVGENNGRMELINFFTMNGTRTTYTRAFGSQDWSGFTFPEGLVNPKETREMFYDYRGKQLPKGIWCDRGQATNNGTFGGYAFRYAYSLEEIYDMNLPPITDTINYYFADCKALKKIEKIRVVSSCTYDNTFSACNSLSYVRFEGTIGNNISFQPCPLDKDSITDIMSHLSTDTTGKTVTFKTSAVNTAFETSKDAADGSTSAEWAALIATRSNWTISLV